MLTLQCVWPKAGAGDEGLERLATLLEWLVAQDDTCLYSVVCGGKSGPCWEEVNSLEVERRACGWQLNHLDLAAAGHRSQLSQGCPSRTHADEASSGYWISDLYGKDNQNWPTGTGAKLARDYKSSWTQEGAPVCAEKFWRWLWSQRSVRLCRQMFLRTLPVLCCSTRRMDWRTLPPWCDLFIVWFINKR